MKKEYDIHKDFLKFSLVKTPTNRAVLAAINKLLSPIFYLKPKDENLTQEVIKIDGFGGGKIKLLKLTPKVRADEKLAALVYFHGGAFLMQAAPQHKSMLQIYAKQTPCVVISVDYRLLPKAKYPMAIEDCYLGYKYVVENAHKLGINPDKILVGGDSAGGTLAISTVLTSRERGIKTPDGAFLIYPAVNDPNVQPTPSRENFTDLPLWNSKIAEKITKKYAKYGIAEYSDPVKNLALDDFPKTYLEVSEFDCLRDEALIFGDKIKALGAEVEINETRQTIHGFEIAINSKITKKILAERAAALKELVK
ncbi:MAG: alpha/beta hydrolase [Christensenellaceae bacterium]|jgi:acetyl esterase/lipase|nr:alpha/beta hydrolase [Christensenellaceae bacterium]